MTTSIASMFNLAGPDLIIILLILLMLGGIPILAVIVVMWVVRRSSKSPPGASPTSQPPLVPTAKDRLERLDTLRQQGQITDAEYAEQRRRILEEI